MQQGHLVIAGHKVDVKAVLVNQNVEQESVEPTLDGHVGQSCQSKRVITPLRVLNIPLSNSREIVPWKVPLKSLEEGNQTRISGRKVAGTTWGGHGCRTYA